MEKGITKERAVAGEGEATNRYEMTGIAKTLLVAVLLGACALAYPHALATWQALKDGPSASSASRPDRNESSSMPTSAPATKLPVVRDQGPKVAAPATEYSEEQAVQRVAWRATTEALSARIGDAERLLGELEAQIAALPRTVPVKAREEVATAGQVVRKTIDTAKAVKVDVGSLPIDFVTAEKSGISGFAKGAISIGSDRYVVGGRLPSGELLVAVDAETRTVVTDKRIVNVSN